MTTLKVEGGSFFRVAQYRISSADCGYQPGGFRGWVCAGIVEEGQTLVCCLNDTRVGGRVEVQNFVQVFGFWHE